MLAGLQREFREAMQNPARDLDVAVETLQSWLEDAAEGEGSGCAVDPGQPGELLTRRADLLAAYQGVVAATAARGSAEAGRRPLDSTLGWSAMTLSGLSGLSGGSALLASLGATLDLRLFDFGRIEAEIDRSRAAEREAWLRYRTAARQAVVEVESALASLGVGRAAVAALDEALARQAGVRADAASLTVAGLADPTGRLRAEEALAQLQEQRAEARFSAQRSLALLIRALGRAP